MKRLAEFFRSVLPADPTQLLFLTGVVCLFVAPHLGWWAAGIGSSPERITDSFAQAVESLGVLFLLPIKFAALAGYFICFWPGNRPVRRVLLSVFLPAMAGLGLIFGRLIYLFGPSSSVLQGTGGSLAHKMSWASSLPWRLLPGFHFCLIGLLLIAAYTSRLAFGITTLPLSLPPGTVLTTASNQGAWKQLQYLVWALVGPFFLVSSLLAFVTLGFPIIISSRIPAYAHSDWFSRISSVIEGLGFLAVASWIAGKEGRQTIWKAIRLPEPKYVGLSLVIPIGIATLLSTGQYLFDRAQWAAHNFGNTDPPQFGSYFTFPDPWLLLHFFPALFEEMIFRGLLQRRFVQRYGIYRGIFLVGIVWAAFHFFSDFAFVRVTDEEAILKLASRLFTCLVLSYVLGWLTLRTGSILPAALAHTFYNVLVLSDFGQPLPGKSTVQIALWAVLAYVLFRNWAVRAEKGPEEAAAI